MRFTVLIITISISIVSAQDIRENIFGFATSNTFTYCDVSDTLFTNNVSRINPVVLRFPGGAVGNFYHYNGKGYGFDFNEIDKYHSGKFPKRARGLDRSRKQKSHVQDYIVDFIKLAKSSNAKAVLVANPFVLSDNDIILMIDKLKENSIEVIGVELGSELSNRSYFTKGYTIDDYVVFAKRCSNAIKSKFPNIKTAVVAAPLGKKRGHRHNKWNEKLANMDFYDAIIIHSYAKVVKGKSLDGKMISENIEKTNFVEEFNSYRNKIIKYFDKDYPSEISMYNSIFNKPIWVTEWNLQMSKTTGNTLLQSLYVAQYFLELLSNSNLSSIDLTTYHNLGGRDFSGSIFNFSDNKLNIRSTFYPIKMIGKIFSSNIVKITSKKEDDTYIYTCYDNKENVILSYKIDWSENLFSCTYLVNDFKYRMSYSSSNLYDRADEKGSLELKVIKLDE